VLIVQVRDYAELRQRYGRFLAERALRRVASAMEDAMRSTDFLGAYGEDGFAAILVEADEEAAENARERYLTLLEQLDVAPANVPGLTLSFACGVATAGEDLSTPQELLAAAHAAATQPLTKAA
jgi:diguanylate cyclase (GGDEF)-like protein